MSDTDLIASSFAGKTNPGDLQLTDGEKALLIKLLANSAFFPEQFKSWLAAIIPLLAPETTVSNVTGAIPVSKIEDYPGDATKVLKGNATWGTVSTGNLGSLVVTDAKVAAANKDGTAATPSMRTLGTSAAQAASGDDARLSDTRVPTDNSVTSAKIADGAITTADLGCLDTDVALAANSDTKIASQKATKTYVDGKAVTGTYAQTVLAANVDLTLASTWYDGPTIALTAGVWLVQTFVYFSGPAGCIVGAHISDGTTVVAESVSSSGGFNTIALSKIVTVSGGGATYRVAGWCSATGAIMAGDAATKTNICAVRIA